MHTLLEELLNYHRHVTTIIDEIAELNKELARTKSGDIREIIIEMLKSLRSDKEMSHHFNEELIRQALMTTDAPIHGRVEQIANDHAAFGRIISNLQSQCKDQGCSAEELSSVINDYIAQYFDHLEAEETIFFPMADKWLNQEQWNTVQQQWR
ncbi:hemerythrin domain-containing protein [Hahella ganghwensis]|uniref:hemerythrin domain-containing protein n=1 Tax=Hahella ganghwensis TaxID=286420 RepID=UPI000361FC90|nr:hemerythrin domain-containing protein [Hahella ganghwensis]